MKINKLDGPENSKKKILFIITQSEMGGAQRFLYHLLKSDFNNNFNNKFEAVLACGPEGNYQLLEELKKEVRSIKLKNLKRNINIFRDLKAIFELKKIIKTYRPDVLFLMSSKAGFVGSLSAKLAKISNLKVIYRIGGWTFNDPWPKWKKNLFIYLERLSAKWKDIIIVNNKHDFDQAQKLNIKPKVKLELIYNGIDLKKLDFLEKDEAKIKLFEHLPAKPANFFRADFIIGTITNFYQTKGLEYLIEAAQLLNSLIPNSKFIILVIGDGPERENLKLKIKKLKLDNIVLLTGQIPEAYKYMKAFDVFVLPSLKEGFPWVILEAMAAKLPIIATSVGALPEIIENGKNGIMVEPRSPQKLAEAIKYLIENERMRNEFGIQAHQTVLFKFPVEKMVRETESLLQY